MSQLALHQTPTDAQSGLTRRMLASARGYWVEAQAYQRFLYCVGALLVLSAIFHAGVAILTESSLAGDVSWRKPITFGESFGLTAISIAWVMTFLPKRKVLGWLLAVPLGLANLGEVFLVSLQQWRGVPSHFNDSTHFDSAIFTLMGLLILFTGVVILVVALLTFFSLKAPPAVAWAIRLGMLLLLAGQVFGGPMIAKESNTFGAAGAMKVPHALALHGAQVLPLLAWLLLLTKWTEWRRTRTVLVGIAGYVTLVAVSAFQAFTGRAPFDLSFGAALGLAIGAALLVTAYATTLTGLQPMREQPAPGCGHGSGPGK